MSDKQLTPEEQQKIAKASSDFQFKESELANAVTTVEKPNTNVVASVLQNAGNSAYDPYASYTAGNSGVTRKKTGIPFSLPKEGASITIKYISKTNTWHKTAGQESIEAPKTIKALLNANNQYSAYFTEEEYQWLSKNTNISIDTAYDPTKAHPFYQSRQGRVVLERNTNVIPISNALGYIHYVILRSSDMIGKNEEDATTNGQDFYFSEEMIDIKEKAKVIKTKNACIAKLAGFDIEDKRSLAIRLAVVFAEYDLDDSRFASFLEASDDDIIVAISKFIDKDPIQAYTEMSVSKEQALAKSQVLKAILTGNITPTGTGFMFMDIMLGYSLDEVVAYWNDPSKTQIKTEILGKIYK